VVAQRSRTASEQRDVCRHADCWALNGQQRVLPVLLRQHALAAAQRTRERCGVLPTQAAALRLAAFRAWLTTHGFPRPRDWQHTQRVGEQCVPPASYILYARYGQCDALGACAPCLCFQGASAAPCTMAGSVRQHSWNSSCSAGPPTMPRRCEWVSTLDRSSPGRVFSADVAFRFWAPLRSQQDAVVNFSLASTHASCRAAGKPCHHSNFAGGPCRSGFTGAAWSLCLPIPPSGPLH
jgi:hypothetical protein